MDCHTISHIEKVFAALEASQVSLGSTSNNFQWDSKSGGSTTTYISFTMCCEDFAPMAPFLDQQPSQETQYAIYLVAKKLFVQRHTGWFKDSSKIPLVAAYRDLPSLSLEQEVNLLLSDGYSRVHLSLAGPLCNELQCTDMFTLYEKDIERLKQRVGEEETKRDKTLAFLMGLHQRLGASSMVYAYMDQDLARMTFQE